MAQVQAIFAFATVVALACMIHGNAASAEDEGYQEGERVAVANAFYRDCHEGGSLFDYYGDGTTYRLPTLEEDVYCQCYGKYMSYLISYSDLIYAQTYRTKSADMLDMEERAADMCATMIAP